MSEYGINGFNLELARVLIMTDITITDTDTITGLTAVTRKQVYEGLAPLIAYFSSRDSTLVIAANKLGSRFFDKFLNIQKKYQKFHIGVTYLHDEDTVKILHSFNRKILFYRDPLDRFLAWYKTFIFLPHATHATMMGAPEYEESLPRELLQAAASKCAFRKSFLENAYNFIMEEDPQELKNLLSADVHTVPLYNFFQYTNIDPLDFHVFDMSDIGEFTLDKFGSWEKQYPQFPVTADKKTLNMMLELHDRLHVIYKNDYDILSPLIKKYPREGI